MDKKLSWIAPSLVLLAMIVVFGNNRYRWKSPQLGPGLSWRSASWSRDTRCDTATASG